VKAEDRFSPEVDLGEPVGAIVGISVEGTAFVVVHHADGWSMFEDRCPHAGCSFVEDGGEIVDGTMLVCACHGSEFDVRDGSLRMGPATRELEVTALEIEGGRLVASPTDGRSIRGD
jgi:nitrite reductase/ring-hydroxylating ferredoxin subunit